ncbi:hypothetical protein SAMN05428988_0150 [Chitinophaga sp. YR573]|uniref:hypothetical protein n=1 Tax=Chitinophaga sp. YR573 TaxID=1881040 RepID=UPI0008C88A11|nr:hypothetical protein [Chitinophaga sp. YR573]SEV88844.1 hypothetical protein SAMN05428988_0150 [Chitinophaga sp. YR573]
MDEQKEYGKKLVKLQNQKEREIREFYYNAIVDLSVIAASLPYKDTIFSLALYPTLKKRVDEVLKTLVSKIEITISSATDLAWDLSDKKNHIFLDKNLRGIKIPAGIKKTLFDSNIKAKHAFKNRLTKGLNLSKRVVKAVEPFRQELEYGLAEGIANGQNAKSMATSMKKNLVEPDKLFRRVKGRNGRLRLSKAALAYKPGQGVYRSSFKNALRITRTETNMSYRTADFERWKSQPFVVGIKVQTSDAHPRPDICDTLEGNYPKDFKWVGWHPHCICYQTPIVITAEEMDKYEDMILGLGKWDGKSVNQVDDVPAEFYKYLKANKDTINGLSSTPYWIEDNEKYMGLLAA